MKHKLPWMMSTRLQLHRKLLRQLLRPSTHGLQMLAWSPPTTPTTPLLNPSSCTLMWLPWVATSPPYLAAFRHTHRQEHVPMPWAQARAVSIVTLRSYKMAAMLQRVGVTARLAMLVLVLCSSVKYPSTQGWRATGGSWRVRCTSAAGSGGCRLLCHNSSFIRYALSLLMW